MGFFNDLLGFPRKPWEEPKKEWKDLPDDGKRRVLRDPDPEKGEMCGPSRGCVKWDRQFSSGPQTKENRTCPRCGRVVMSNAKKPCGEYPSKILYDALKQAIEDAREVGQGWDDPDMCLANAVHIQNLRSLLEWLEAGHLMVDTVPGGDLEAHEAKVADVKREYSDEG